jgi:hypothetical protein
VRSLIPREVSNRSIYPDAAETVEVRLAAQSHIEAASAGGLFQPPPRWRTLANYRAAVAFPQSDKDSRLQVYGLLARGLRGLVGYQGGRNLPRRHRGTGPSQHVHRAPKQRPICSTASTCIMAVLILTPAFRFSANFPASSA